MHFVQYQIKKLVKRVVCLGYAKTAKEVCIYATPKERFISRGDQFFLYKKTCNCREMSPKILILFG